VRFDRGIISRLLVPRSVRRAAHPVRTARWAVTPRPIKKVRRAVYVATNRFGAAEGALENAVVDALRPSRQTPRRRVAQSPTLSRTPTAQAREVRHLDAAHGDAIIEAARSLHLTARPTVQLPPAPAPFRIDDARVRAQMRRNAVRGVGLFKRSERRSRLLSADAATVAEIELERTKRETLQDEHQRILDRAQTALLGNDPTAVWWATATALKQFPVEAVVAGVVDGAVDLVVKFPGLELVGEEAAAVTPSGRPSTRHRTLTERNELYSEALASAAMVVMLAAVQAAPAMMQCRVIVLGPEGDVLLAADASADGLAAAHGMRPLAVLQTAGTLRLLQKGRTKAVAPIPREGFVAEIAAELVRLAGENLPPNPSTSPRWR
jgi:hypothetical protein